MGSLPYQLVQDFVHQQYEMHFNWVHPITVSTKITSLGSKHSELNLYLPVEFQGEG